MRAFGIYCIFIMVGIQQVSAQYSMRDTIPLMEIIINDTKFAGGKVEIIDPVILESRLGSSLADVLSENTTLYIHSAAKGSLATASMRGAGASHTKVLWEGFPINSPMTGQVDFSLLPVYFTDDVSLYFGSASLVNTGGALGGSISLNNTPDWSTGMHGKLIQGIGSFGTYSTMLQANGAKAKIASRIRVFTEQSKNNFKYFNNTVPEAYQEIEYQENASFSRKGLLQELFYRVSDNSMLGLNYWYQDSERDLPRLMNNRAAEHDEKQFDTNHRLQTSFKHYGTMFNWELNSGFAFNELNYYLKNKPLGSSEMNTNLDSRSITYTSITQYRALKKWSNQWNLDFQASIAFNYAEFYDQKYLTGYKNNQNEHTLFAGLHKSFGIHWKLSTLIRQQIIEGNFIKPIPSLGAVYSIFETNPLSFKANVSRNYHNPTLNQLYFMPGGNPNLRPEEGSTSEFSINSLINAGHSIYKNEVSVYYSVINDWILWKPSQFGYWVPQNTQKVHSRGIEYTGKITREVNGLKTEIALKYAFTPTTNESTNLAVGDASKGHQLIYIPLHNGGYTELVSYKGFDFIWSSFYTGLRNTATVSNDDNIPLSGYWLSNMSLGKKIRFKENQLSISFTIDNVFNKDYQSIKYRAMPGRNYYLMVNFEF